MGFQEMPTEILEAYKDSHVKLQELNSIYKIASMLPVSKRDSVRFKMWEHINMGFQEMSTEILEAYKDSNVKLLPIHYMGKLACHSIDIYNIRSTRNKHKDTLNFEFRLRS